MNKIVPKLSSIIIGTNNIKKAKRFYETVFHVTVEHEDESYISSKSPDGQKIEIEAMNEHRFLNWEKHNIGTYKNTEFEVSDIYGFFDIVRESGGSILSEPKLQPWGYAGEIKDLDGNTFLIIQKK